MPSPLAHTAMGYLIYRLSRRRLPGAIQRQAGPLPVLFVAAVLFSLLPDVDAIVGVLTGQMIRFHNNGTHSLLVGLLLAGLVAWLAWRRWRVGFWSWGGVLFSSYALHGVMDAFTLDGRGVMLLWPLSEIRFRSPVALFYGVQWGDGLVSPAHLVTLATEGVFVLLALLIAHGGEALAYLRKIARPRLNA